jgi:membrane protein
MKRKLLFFLRFVKQVVSEFIADNILKYSASLAYYTILSLAPLLIIVLFISGALFGKEAIRGELYGEMKGMVGNEAAQTKLPWRFKAQFKTFTSPMITCLQQDWV